MWRGAASSSGKMGNRDFTGEAEGREGTAPVLPGSNCRKSSQGGNGLRKLAVMSTSSPTNPSHDYDAFPPVTLVQLADRFGDIPATRICLNPPPGQATEADMLYFQEHEDRLFELVDGTLIEKTMGNYESHIAGEIFGLLYNYLKAHPIGAPLMADAQLGLRPGAIRLPDVTFLSNERIRRISRCRRRRCCDRGRP